jgi:hypothetical protein
MTLVVRYAKAMLCDVRDEQFQDEGSKKEAAGHGSAKANQGASSRK